ncbi:hypothetical protein BN871_GN_00200 [Paenibacillus sp. P22]|nr:hypothetical protein BN871_GN_00200 [Paenibacillus sp. P22]
MSGVERHRLDAPVPHTLDDLWFKLRDAAPCGIEVDNGRLKPEWEGDFRLIALTAGAGRLVAGERSIPLRAGSVYISFPGEPLRATADSAHRMEMFIFRFSVLKDSAADRGATEAVKDPFPRVEEVAAYPAVALTSLCKSICACWGSLDMLERFRGQSVFVDLLHRLFKEAQSGTDQELDAALEVVRTYIEQHYEQELTVKKLAEMSRISPRHLMRLFKENYGVSISDYIKALKNPGKQASPAMPRSAIKEKFRRSGPANYRADA